MPVNVRAESRTSFVTVEIEGIQAKARVVSPLSAIVVLCLRSGQMPDRGRTGFFRSNLERVWIERHHRPAAGAMGATGCPLGVPKKRKKSDFGLMTMRVSPPFNPVS
jgi:hypothetical protein